MLSQIKTPADQDQCESIFRIDACYCKKYS